MDANLGLRTWRIKAQPSDLRLGEGIACSKGEPGDANAQMPAEHSLLAARQTFLPLLAEGLSPRQDLGLVLKKDM